MKLERFAYTPLGTFGRLIAPEFMVWTVERPWVNNAPRESCIPEGTYELAPTTFNAGRPPYATWEVVGVPGRSLIKIHRANTMNDLLGCIGVGRRLGVVQDRDTSMPLDWAVVDSRGAFDLLVDAMAREPRPLQLVVTHREGDGILK